MIEKRTSASSEPISEATTFDFQGSQKVLLLFITTQVVFKNNNLRCKSIRTNIRACYRARIHPIFLPSHTLFERAHFSLLDNNLRHLWGYSCIVGYHICEWVAIGGCEYHG